MLHSENGPTTARQRLLITAYHYDREYSMESRLAWRRAQCAARDYDVTVICARAESRRAADLMDVGEQVRPVDVVRLPLSRTERTLMSRTPTYYFGYRLWQRRVFRKARRLNGKRPFDLVHHVSFCGYREPGDCWRLGIPFVWGPVGGTHSYPWAFVKLLDLRGAIREATRNAVNRWQLRFGRRVRRAVHAADELLAANRAAAQDLAYRRGSMPDVQLETGISAVRSQPRPRRADDQPLRILWAGRLRPWKGLPLLLHALAGLPASCRYTLRVLGQGDCRERWQSLARSLGVDKHVEWAGWPRYRDQLPHYDWADVFAFTSLRDTSGTGLLEALAAGAPLVGVDHQGAADIMTDACAVRVPATDPRAAIAGFRGAILKLATDPDFVFRLGEGALERACDYLWERQYEVMREVYRRAAAPVSLVEPLPAPAPWHQEFDVRPEDEPNLAAATSSAGACT